MHLAEEDVRQYLEKHSEDPEVFARVHAHLVECSACKDQFVGGLDALLAELLKGGETLNPREFRALTSRTASVQALSPLSFERIEVEVTNTSTTGYGIRTGKPLAPGTIVEVLVDGTCSIGTVRFCHKQGNLAYNVGIQIQTRLK